MEITRLNPDEWSRLNILAIAEKYRTDMKYGMKESGGRDKAVVVSIIVESLGAMLDKMRYSDNKEEVEKYFVRILAHLMTLSTFLDRPLKRGAQYMDEGE